MKKYMGNYTNEAAKALKGSERIICRVTDDGAIYVTNGFIAYKMTPPEYAAIVQPVTCCEAGNYTMQNGEKAADNGFDLVKLFNETVEQTANAPALERCPLTLQAGKAPAASYYNPAAGVASFYNAKFIAALTPSATLRATGAISAAVYDSYDGMDSLAGLQMTGKAVYIDPLSDEYRSVIEARGVQLQQLQQMPAMLHAVRLDITRYELLDGALRSEGYAARQVLSLV